MNEAVLLSIHPQHCKNIISGLKTRECRKNIPHLTTPFKCYIYESAGNVSYKKSFETHWDRRKARSPYIYEGRRKVIAEFVCTGFDQYFFGQLSADTEASYLVAPSDLNKLQLTADELNSYGCGKLLYGWKIEDLKVYDHPRMLDSFTGRNGLPVMQAPQSWCYVEEEC